MSSVDADPTLPFEAWAALSARMLRRDSEARASILKQAGVDDERWAYSDARWTGELVRDLERRDYTRVERYGRDCAAELAHRRAAEARMPSTAGAASPADFADTVSLNDSGRPSGPMKLVTEDAVVVDDPTLPFQQGGSTEFVHRLPPSPTREPKGLGEETVELPAFDADRPVLPFGRPARST